MKWFAYGAAFAGALGLSATAWAQAPANGAAPANQPMTPGPAAPAAPNQPAQANATTKPQALASSPVCPPAHKRVARHYYRGHAASRTNIMESRVASRVAAVAPPPVFYEPPPPPPFWYAPPPPRPWYPGPWRGPWRRPWR